MQKTPKLDFLIIGAQKSGTTTLHEILRQHPQIMMPEGKEWPYFNQPEGDFEFFFKKLFGTYDPALSYGKATPQYLNDPTAAARIGKAFPEVKLIAILRNPVARTFSHYNMCIRRTIIEDDFETAVDRWLEPGNLGVARSLPHASESEAQCCVVWSEYSRMLERYNSFSQKNNILVLFLEDLERHPQAVFDQIATFLGLDTMIDSAVVNQKFHVGGSKRKLRLPVWVKKIPGVKKLTWLFFKSMPPKVAFAYEMWNVVPANQSVQDAYPEASAKLNEHFRNEGDKLFEIFGVRATW